MAMRQLLNLVFTMTLMIAANSPSTAKVERQSLQLNSLKEGDLELVTRGKTANVFCTLKTNKDKILLQNIDENGVIRLDGRLIKLNELHDKGSNSDNRSYQNRKEGVLVRLTISGRSYGPEGEIKIPMMISVLTKVGSLRNSGMYSCSD